MSFRELTVKERVLLHLFDYARFQDAYEVPVEVTQAGIAQSVGIRVHHVPQYVRPLLADGFVSERTSHVQRHARRRKTYSLTPKGRGETSALRDGLLQGDVPFRGLDGTTKDRRLEEVYQEERRGTRLLALVAELKSHGHIGPTAEVKAKEMVDFTQDAPSIGRFYGRSDELGGVTRALAETPMVVIIGLPGMGKTTMAAKICDSLRGARSLFWRQVRPWDSAYDLVARVAAFLAAHGRRGLQGHLAGPQAREWGRIEELLSLDVRGVDGVLVFDDVQNASSEAQTFFAIILRAVTKVKGPSVLVLSRTGPAFYSRRHVEVERSVREIHLGGLDRPSGMRLLSDAGVADPFLGGLVDACGAVPLFLKIVARGGPTPAMGEVRTTMDQYLAEELEPSLDPEERGCLEVACFYQIPIPAEGLLLEEPVRWRILSTLERKGLVDRMGPDRYILHDFLRSYFQRGLSLDRRAILANRTVSWLRGEAEASAKRGRPYESIAYLSNAVACDPDDERRRATLEEIGDLRKLVGDAPAALEAYRTAMKLAELPTTKARLHRKMAVILTMTGQLSEGEQEIRAGLEILPAAPSLDRGWLLQCRAWIALKREDYDRTLEDIQRVTELMAALPVDPALRAYLANLSGLVHLQSSKHMGLDQAKADFTTAAESYEAVADFQGLSRAYNNLGWVAIETGRTDDALANLDRSAAIADSIGDLPGRQVALQTKAFCLSEMLGDTAAAEAMLEESYRLAKSTYQPDRTRWLHWHFGELYRRQGRYEEAKESHVFFMRLSEGKLDVDFHVRHLGLLVRTCLLAGDSGAAESYVGQAQVIAREGASDIGNHHLEWAQGALAAAQGQREAAEACFSRAESLATHGWHGEFFLEYGQFLASIRATQQARGVLERAERELTKDALLPLAARAREALAALP